ncbi:MAG: MobF family relaxase [Acidimicrobiales bacterium]
MRLAKLGVGAERYYLATVAAGWEDHRPAGLEPDGVWLGSGSARLGLGGRVEAAELEAVLAGSDPGSGELLNAYQSRVRVVGYDLVFAAPKSVSVLFGVADAQPASGLQRAHEAAVGDALGYLERAAVSARRQDHARRWSVPTGGVVAAGFVHRTSRMADPHLHTHVLVGNLVEGSDGRWTALDARGLYAHGVTAGYLYQARLRQELVRCTALRLGPVSHGVANVAGVEPAVLAHFSQRRSQVTRQLEAWGASSPRAAQAAALATRPGKDSSRSVEELRGQWCQRAERLGMSQGWVSEILGEPPSAPSALGVASSLELASVAGALVERTGTFGRRDLLRAVAQSLVGGADVATVERLSDELVTAGGRSGGLVSRGADVERWRGRHGRRVVSGVVEGRWTTAERARAEADLLREAGERAAAEPEATSRARPASEATRTAGPSQHQQAEEILDGVLSRRPELGPSQVQAVRHLVRSESGLEVLWTPPGPPGADVIEAAREAWQLAGCKVLGLAATQAEGSAIEASTGVTPVPPPSSDTEPARAIPAEIGPGEVGPPSIVLLVMGAQRCGLGELSELVRSAGRAKLVLVADPRAAGPSSGVLRQLDRGVPEHPPPEVERRPAGLPPLPVGAPLPLRVELVRADGQPRQVVVGLTAPGLRRALVDDWWSLRPKAGGAVMVAQTRGEVEALNGEARARMLEAGELQGGASLGRIELAVGDHVQLRWGHARWGLDPGGQARVIGFRDDPVRDARTSDARAADGRGMPDALERDGRGADGRGLPDHEATHEATHKAVVLRSGSGAEATLPLDQLSAGQLVHGYAITAEEARHRHDAPTLVLGGPEVFVPERQASDGAPGALSHYVLDAELALRSAPERLLADERGPHQLMRSDPLLELTPRAASGRGAPPTHDVARSLAELGPELEGLRSELLAGLPPDPSRQLADLVDERAAVELGRANAVALSPGMAGRWEQAAERVAERSSALEQAGARRDGWLVEHLPDLARYGELTRAVEQRQLLLGRVAEVVGHGHIRAELGSPPPEGSERAAWREAAGAVEAFRERWGVADEQRALGHDHALELARSRERGVMERTVADAQRQLGLERDRSHERSIGRSIERDIGRDSCASLGGGGG